MAIRVLRRGQSAPAGTLVQVARYDAGLGFKELLEPLVLDASGAAQLDLRAFDPGFTSYGLAAYEPESKPEPAPPFSRMLSYQLNVRTMPFDDELETRTTDAELSWTWVYERILSFWDTQNPVMARKSGPAINRPLHDQQTMEAMTGAIRALTSTSMLVSYRYMPPARDLSAGKRRLLHRWCDLVDNGVTPAAQIERLNVQFHSNDRRLEPE